MNMLSNQPARLRVTMAVLLVAVLAGAVALMRDSPAQSGEPPPTAAKAAPAKEAAPAPLQADTLPAAAKGPAVATLGAVQVDRDELVRQLESLPPEARAQLKGNRGALDQWLRARLAEKALVEQARAQGWQERPELKRAFQAAQERIVLQTYLDSVTRAPDDYPAEADLRSAYERAKPQLAQPALYRVSQIFLPAALDDSDAVAAARKQAQDLVKRAQAPKADFAALAQRYSQDGSSRAQGGDIGYLPLAQLMPEMRPAVEQLKAGEVSAPLQSAAGFHILKLVDLRAASVTPYERVKDELRAALRTQRQELAARAYLEGLLNAGTVSIDGAALNAAFDQTAAATVAQPAVAARAP
ncbi:peptidylprolyl isomerase [Achromobacter pulmonis]|uniref:Chaperone SurA n=1 Tax=Achromobacter pulmonis TaxID=1389932 RepID=A0A6S7CIQ9_9BURK|nr:peptidylprolyl isomerase [Achromobacter pulmonis]MCF7769521.1 peptidylprolyl isomerase [Achromobacter pulmonis]CAB3636204.1 Chaperone SurA [Achromobacter pulmonis]CAB3849256.1 Chaperone SurA [Achromobacter pulmonis]